MRWGKAKHILLALLKHDIMADSIKRALAG